MRFSPILVGHLIIEPLRYFFHNYPNESLYWDEDPKKSKMEIGAFYSYYKLKIQEKPRILVSRGTYTISGTGLTDDLATGKSVFETKGLNNLTNMVMIDGMANILIEGRHEGTVELLGDMVTHFLVWSKPYICESQGFKKFAIPMQVTPPQANKEDAEILQININIPYYMEEQWNVKSDALKLNQFFLNLKPPTG